MKAQSSFEYLLTWGWALLLILGGVSIFYSFDLISFDQFVSSTCEVYGQFDCVETNAGYDTALSTGEVRFRLYNGIGSDVVLYNFTVTGNGFACASQTPDIDWPRSTELLINVTGCTGDTFFEGERLEGIIEFSFYKNYTKCQPVPTAECLFGGRGIVRQNIFEE